MVGDRLPTKDSGMSRSAVGPNRSSEEGSKASRLSSDARAMAAEPGHLVGGREEMTRSYTSKTSFSGEGRGDGQ